MTHAPLPTASPAEAGVDPAGVEAFLDALEGDPRIEPHSLMLIRHGAVVAQGWWAPYSADRVHLLYSLSKSFTSTAAGLAVADGLLDLDAPAVSYFPEFDAEITDPGSRGILVRHLASMATGHTEDMWEPAVTRDPAEPVRGFLLLPPSRPPGSVFAYNQPATYTLATIVQRVTGATLTDYLRPRIFDPLGIGPTSWLQRPAGRDIGFTGLHATTDAVARLGLLYLQRGVWDGRSLLAESWVEQATRTQVANPAEPNPDWQQGYGFQFWMSRHGYRGDGAYGQYCIVLPEQDAVIAITSETEAMQAVLDAVWEHLLPAFGATREPSGAADDALASRLARLVLPVRPGTDRPADPAGWATEFRPASPCIETITGAAVRIDQDGATLIVHDDGTTLSFPVPGAAWRTLSVEVADQPPVPAAISGGWTADDTLAVDIIFLETPHTLRVRLDRAAQTVSAHWRTGPLHGGALRDQRAP